MVNTPRTAEGRTRIAQLRLVLLVLCIVSTLSVSCRSASDDEVPRGSRKVIETTLALTNVVDMLDEFARDHQRYPIGHGSALLQKTLGRYWQNLCWVGDESCEGVQLPFSTYPIGADEVLCLTDEYGYVFEYESDGTTYLLWSGGCDGTRDSSWRSVTTDRCGDQVFKDGERLQKIAGMSHWPLFTSPPPWERQLRPRECKLCHESQAAH